VWVKLCSVRQVSASTSLCIRDFAEHSRSGQAVHNNFDLPKRPVSQTWHGQQADMHRLRPRVQGDAEVSASRDTRDETGEERCRGCACE
jgi:hypothetical protein